MTGRSPRRSPLAMAVLLLLAHEPLHPYGLRQRIQECDQDRVVNVSQRNAIYQIIERLERAGLIAVRETARNERRPERTVYEATRLGVATARQWLLDALSTPVYEYPEFPAALAFLGSVSPADMRDALELRAKALAERIASLEAEATAPCPLETDYLRAMWRAELSWLDCVLRERARQAAQHQ